MGKKKTIQVVNTRQDLTTEEKIKAAARKVFTQKGYAATRTRDIAQEAGINLALLNYYFRSKEKLFELIMFESAARFFMQLQLGLNDPESSLEQKIELLVDHYLKLLSEEPNFPVFILGEIQANPERLLGKLKALEFLPESVFFKQLQERMKKNNIKLHPMHMLVNFLGMMVFPFVVRPMLLAIFKGNNEQFRQLMLERRNLIPAWMMQMLGGKTKSK